MKKNLKSKLAVLFLIVVMMFALSGCDAWNFLKNGWDYTDGTYTYTDGLLPGVDANGNTSFYQYQGKGVDAYGRVFDASGNIIADPKQPATNYTYWFYEWKAYNPDYTAGPSTY